MVDPTLTPAEKRAILLVTCTASFLFPFMGSTVNVALPAIGADLHLTAVQLAWVSTSFLLTSAVLLVPAGRFADMRGRKRVFIGGVCLYILGSVAASLASSGLILVLSRIVQGAGGAMLTSTSLAILSSAYGRGERGKALGINTASIYSGLSLGPVVGGLLTQSVGWRGVFIVNIPLGLLLLLAAVRRLPKQEPTSPQSRFDRKGLAAYAVFLVAAMYGMTALPDAIGYVSIGIGACGLFVLIRVEGRTSDPLIDIELFRTNLGFALSNVAALLNYAATFAAGFLLSLYLQIVGGLSPGSTGLVLVSMPAVQAAVSPIAGRLSDRIEPRILASVGMVITVLALVTMTQITLTTPISHTVAGLALLGFGVGIFSSPNTNAVMTSVPPAKYGLGAATLSTTRQVGMVTSMAVATLIISSRVGDVSVGSASLPAFVEAVRLSFAVSAVACTFGVFASLKRGRLHAL
jgi:EmrB/QacA subfamily drug resistance transporter